MGQRDQVSGVRRKLDPGRWWLLLEFVILFGLGPLMMAEVMPKRLIIPSILMFFALCLTLLMRDPSFARRELWNGGRVRKELSRIVVIWVAAAACVTGLVLALVPEVFLSLPRERPGLWLVIMLAYPLASVYPQQVIFRTFVFHRYRDLFGRRGEWGMVVVSAAAFGCAHVVLGNWLAIVATLVGGVLFAWTYSRTRSVAAVAMEHAMYGCLMFTVGLGKYFYGGAWG